VVSRCPIVCNGFLKLLNTYFQELNIFRKGDER